MAKLGTSEHPAVVRVQTMERAQDITEYAGERGWIVIVGVEPDEIENVSDFNKLLRAEREPATKPGFVPKISGNDYCPCRSGKKYKKCCGAPPATA